MNVLVVELTVTRMLIVPTLRAVLCVSVKQDTVGMEPLVLVKITTFHSVSVCRVVSYELR